MYIDSITTLSAPYSVTANTCSGAIAASATCSVTIEYSPSIEGMNLAEFVVTYGPTLARDTENTSTTQVVGVGVVPSSANEVITISSELDFGSITLGSSAVDLVKTFTNASSATIYISSVSNGLSAPFSLIYKQLLGKFG